MGVKIAGHELQRAVAGTTVLVVHPDDEIEDLKQEVMKDLEHAMASFEKQSPGVFVQASTLGVCCLALLRLIQSLFLSAAFSSSYLLCYVVHQAPWRRWSRT
jgi:translation initiation factor IF-2